MPSKSILIIASERGLGLGLARQFLERGWSVVGTAKPRADTAELRRLATEAPSRLDIASIDVTDAGQIEPFLEELGPRRFDVIYFNAGIWGATHQSVSEATDDELAEIMLTNAFGPIRLAHRLLDHIAPSGTYCFMSSHRGSIAGNLEGGLELYRASKVALNMLARGLWATNRNRDLTVLSIHPGWVNTDMGTLNGTVDAEMELEPSVRGVADVVEGKMGLGQNLYLDWQGAALDW